LAQGPRTSARPAQQVLHCRPRSPRTRAQRDRRFAAEAARARRTTALPPHTTVSPPTPRRCRAPACHPIPAPTTAAVVVRWGLGSSRLVAWEAPKVPVASRGGRGGIGASEESVELVDGPHPGSPASSTASRREQTGQGRLPNPARIVVPAVLRGLGSGEVGAAVRVHGPVGRGSRHPGKRAHQPRHRGATTSPARRDWGSPTIIVFPAGLGSMDRFDAANCAQWNEDQPTSLGWRPSERRSVSRGTARRPHLDEAICAASPRAACTHQERTQAR
jgi:hypothetical protein